MTHRTKINKGELPMYVVEDAHEAIIDKATFEAVQAEHERRRGLGVFANWSIKTSALTAKIKCGKCGASFHRKSRKAADGGKRGYWRCGTMDKKGATACHMKDVPETKILQSAAKVLGMDGFCDTAFAEMVAGISVPCDFALVFALKDGAEIHRTWESTAKKDSWTSEARQAAARRMSKRNKNGRWSPEARQRQSERMKNRYAKNPNWNRRGGQ